MQCADNICRFCNQDEVHDPSEEFEEYLSCTVCGDHCTWIFICGPDKKKELSKPLDLLAIPADSANPNYIAHRQCAQEHDSLHEGMSN